MPENTIKKTKIVIIGNGFGGVYTLKNLYKFFGGNKNIEISLIGEKNYFLFTPLLHEVATGGINPINIIEPIRKVLKYCLSEFYLGKGEIIDLEKYTVKIKENILVYDYLVLAPGAKTNFYNIKGAEENTLTLKSLEDAIRVKNRIIAQVEKAAHIRDKEKRKKMLTFMVVGGGPTGVELAAEIQEMLKENFSQYFKKEIIEDTSVVIIQKSAELLTQFGKKIREESLQVLKKKKIEIMLNTEVKEVGPDYIIINDNKKIFGETIIWVGGIKPAELNFSQKVSKTPNGKLLVNKYLQLENYKNVFALGDIAAFSAERADDFLPALAQVAEKEAKMVARNIYLLVNGKEPEAFKYNHTGDMVSLGRWMAIGEIAQFTFWGHITWWLWRTVYLSKLISFRKKVRVAIDWTLNIFSPRDISEF